MDAFRKSGWEGADALAERLRQRMERARDEGPRIVVIEPENADAVRLFIRLQTQWRIEHVAIGGKHSRIVFFKTGIDYGVLPVIAGALGIALDADALDALRDLERETIRLDTERQMRNLRRR